MSPDWFTYPLADTALCAAAVARGTCTGPYQKSNNKIRLYINRGNTINVAFVANDYDWGSADDELCHVNAKIDPFAFHSGDYVLHSPWNGDGECHVTIKLNFV